MTATPHLVGLTVSTGHHAGAIAKLAAALGLHVAVLEDVAEIRCDDGAVVRFAQSRESSPIRLAFRVPDVDAAAAALDAQGATWKRLGDNRIRAYRGGLTVEAVQAAPGQPAGLASATLFVTDIDRTSMLLAAAALPVEDVSRLGIDPDDPPFEAADVVLDGVRLQLRQRGGGAPTVAHIVIRADDPLGSCVGLDYLGADYRHDRDEVTVVTPDGCGVRLVPA